MCVSSVLELSLSPRSKNPLVASNDGRRLCVGERARSAAEGESSCLGGCRSEYMSATSSRSATVRSLALTLSSSAVDTDTGTSRSSSAQVRLGEGVRLCGKRNGEGVRPRRKASCSLGEDFFLRGLLGGVEDLATTAARSMSRTKASISSIEACISSLTGFSTAADTCSKTSR